MKTIRGRITGKARVAARKLRARVLSASGCNAAASSIRRCKAGVAAAGHCWLPGVSGVPGDGVKIGSVVHAASVASIANSHNARAGGAAHGTARKREITSIPTLYRFDDHSRSLAAEAATGSTFSRAAAIPRKHASTLRRRVVFSARVRRHLPAPESVPASHQYHWLAASARAATYEREAPCATPAR